MKMETKAVHAAPGVPPACPRRAPGAPLATGATREVTSTPGTPTPTGTPWRSAGARRSGRRDGLLLGDGRHDDGPADARPRRPRGRPGRDTYFGTREIFRDLSSRWGVETSMWAVFFGAPPGVIYDPLAEPAGEKQDAAMDAAFVLCEPTCSRSARSEPATASRRCRRVACHPLLVFTEVRGKWIFTSFVNSACTEGRDRHRGAAFGSAPEALRELARDEPPAAAALRAGLFGRGRVAECDGVARVRSEGAATTAGFA